MLSHQTGICLTAHICLLNQETERAKRAGTALKDAAIRTAGKKGSATTTVASFISDENHSTQPCTPSKRKRCGSADLSPNAQAVLLYIIQSLVTVLNALGTYNPVLPAAANFQQLQQCGVDIQTIAAAVAGLTAHLTVLQPRPRPRQGGKRITEAWLHDLEDVECRWYFRCGMSHSLCSCVYHLPVDSHSRNCNISSRRCAFQTRGSLLPGTTSQPSRPYVSSFTASAAATTCTPSPCASTALFPPYPSSSTA